MIFADVDRFRVSIRRKVDRSGKLASKTVNDCDPTTILEAKMKGTAVEWVSLKILYEFHTMALS